MGTYDSSYLEGIPKVDISEMKSFRDEDSFTEKSFDLLKETGMLATLVASFMGSTGKWDMKQAIVGGSLIRLQKLIQAVLDQTMQRRQDTAILFPRMCFETCVNVRYFIKNYSEELLKEYISVSIAHEKKQISIIEENVAKRGGEYLPIEQRIIQSIRRMEEVSGVDLDKMDPKIKRWGKQGDLAAKADSLGWEHLYLPFCKMASCNIHGGWRDLYMNHLDFLADGGFKPKFDRGYVRPQQLNSLSLITLETLRDSLPFLAAGYSPEDIVSRLDCAYMRVVNLDRAHEVFLSSL